MRKLMSQNKTKVKIPVLPADSSRCLGVIYAHGGRVNCPQANQCIRFLSPPVENHPRQVYVMITGEDQIGNCSDFEDVKGFL
jgi:hypothetical protein